MGWDTSSIDNASPTWRVILSWIFPSAFMLAGALLCFFGVRQVVHAKASEEWPSTSGRVLESLVKSRWSQGGSDGHGERVYEAEVLYEYVVEDTTYKGNRVTASSWATDDPSRAQRTVNRYPEDTDVTVYYMPDDPEQSLLEPGVTGMSAIMPAMGAGFLIIGFMVGLMFNVAFKHVDRKKALADPSSA